ncbi:helix-turn-helix domain-containing protein [uncultured Chitinophaga sp.]|jgi:Predicted transcriptional regulators|uniref:winged helix-turn-helix transcriptional regulator n=1 Tax=uncultured Chitinophaga sp. TaxID=339340 RepID=UPI002637401A|nr:helix-turn-helix domain-containing protein [uncultured Chitinophaga sp.]
MVNKTSKICAPSDEACKIFLRSVGDALYVVGGKWRLQIIIALYNGNNRFNQIQRTVEGISARVLSNELKELELIGFISREVDAGSTPVTVSYQLTPYCNTLEEVIMALSRWGMKHRKKMTAK